MTIDEYEYRFQESLYLTECIIVIILLLSIPVIAVSVFYFQHISMAIFIIIFDLLMLISAKATAYTLIERLKKEQ